MLSEKERLVLYALTRYPEDSNLALQRKTGIKYPTFVAIKRRLERNKNVRTINVPLLQNLGCELFAVVYLDFNPAVDAETRIKKTKKTIEVFDELFFSVGETQTGFSFSFSKNYTELAKINDIRVRVFTQLDVLGTEKPKEIIFPLSTSRIYKFFDFAPLLKKDFKVGLEDRASAFYFNKSENISLTKTEKLVYCALIRQPELNDNQLEKKLNISRHTVSVARKKFTAHNLIKKINIPNLKELGYNILCFSHLVLKEGKNIDPRLAKNPAVIFFASRGYEKIMLSVYKKYADFKLDNESTTKWLKENELFLSAPVIRIYSIGTMIVIKDLVFAPIAEKILGISSTSYRSS